MTEVKHFRKKGKAIGIRQEKSGQAQNSRKSSDFHELWDHNDKTSFFT